MDVVFEENEHHSFQPSPSLSFLRPKPTYSTPYASAEMNQQPPISLPAVRRPRAGTMPSFIHPEATRLPSNNNSSAALLLNTFEPGRHRSGSLNLPPVEGSFWGLRHDGPLSPSSEQLLQNDSDFSIARTMRSLGLEEDDDQEKEQQKTGVNINSLFHHQSPPEFHMPSRSLLSGNNRNRSYSVNAAARYDPSTDMLNHSNNTTATNLSRTSLLNLGNPNNTIGYLSPLEGFTNRQQQQNRPRASSMGRADAGRLLPPIGLWNTNTTSQQQPQRSSPLVSMKEEDGLSLGDSELLANLLHGENDQQQQQQHEIVSNIHEVRKRDPSSCSLIFFLLLNKSMYINFNISVIMN